MFKEDKRYSPMRNNVIEQASRIYEIISDAGKFKTYYNDLINNVVDSLNSQCRSYVRNSKKSINIDVYDCVMERINWSELQSRLATNLKANKSLQEVLNEDFSGLSNSTSIEREEGKSGPLDLKWHKLGDLSDYSIELYDYDPIINMYSNYGEETLKDYVRYMKEATTNLKDLEANVAEYEKDLCAYRDSAVKIVLSKNLPVLYAIHYGYVKKLMSENKGKGKNNGKEVIKFDGVELELKRSQKEFIVDGLKKLICRDVGKREH